MTLRFGLESTTFNYTLFDGNGGSDTGTMNLLVTGLRPSAFIQNGSDGDNNMAAFLFRTKLSGEGGNDRLIGSFGNDDL
jgi:Ca2+-binding RTX toxin-like protein